MNACTIIAKNYLAHARVLARSFAEHHPDGRFTVLVLDEIDGRFDPADEPFEVIAPSQIDLPEFEQMAGAYDVLELSTAVKPWLLRRLLRDHEHVVYLDPDIRVYAPCDRLAELAVEHGIVLTPHNVAAMPRDGKKPSETDILIAGAYNLGFIAVSSAEASLEFLDWWAERLRTDCIVDTDRGYFVDQRWIDLVPGMVPSFELLRDPAYNVAYWNLHSRPVAANHASYTIAGAPLRFFHFSGYDPRDPHRLSKHQDRIELTQLPALRELCDAYGAELFEQGFETTIKWPYTYAKTADGLPLTRPLRRIYADGLRDGVLEHSVFEREGASELVDYAQAPAEGVADARVTRFALAVHESRRDIREAFPALAGEDLEGYLRWFAEEAPGQLGPGLSALSGIEPGGRAPRPIAGDSKLALGVNLVGYFSAELGVGEVARQVVGALDTQRVGVLPIGLIASASRQGHAFGQRQGFHGPFAINLMCVNADQTPSVAADAGPDFFRDRYTIGWWWWEIGDFPDQWRGAFDCVDELWAGSRFVAETLAAVSPKPVIHIPMPVSLPAAIHPDRAGLGLPQDTFIFLVVFDHNSVFERKNPVGAIEAFSQAFPEPRDEVCLVVKSINGDKHPDDRARLCYAAAGRPDVILMDDYLSFDLKNALMASCDAYVSLHRAEGFGISLAEAMLLRKPVIASQYSGTADFIHPDTAYPVRCAITAIGPGNEPYAPDGTWGDPDLAQAAHFMRVVFDDRDGARERAEAGATFIEDHHSAEVAGRAMRRRLEQIARIRPPAARADTVAQTQEIVDHVRTLGLRGPLRSSARRLSPTRLVRGLVLRTNRPVISYSQELHRGLVDALAQTTQIALDAADGAGGRAETTALSQSRQLEARVAALEADLRPITAQVPSLAAVVGELHEFSREVHSLLDVAALAELALTATPYVAGTPFAPRDEPAAGRVLGLSQDAPPPSPNARGFADVFRGEEPLVREALHPYLDVIAQRSPVVDLSCGRGEFLDLLAERGTPGVGVDIDAACVARCREKGHEVHESDALAWLEAAEPGSLGALLCARLAERLAPDVLVRLLAAARRALSPDGVLVLENTNPYAPHALKLFWVDPANRHPLFPEAMLALARIAGFADAYAYAAGGTGDYDTDRLNEGAYAVVARGLAAP